MGSIISTLKSTASAISAGLRTVLTLHKQFSSLLERASSEPGFPVPKPTKSYWLDDPPFPALCDIQDDKLPSEVDIVVIGSGITGAAVTKSLLELSNSSLRVVVCEARQLCSGATGRNGGHIKSAPYDEFAMFKSKLGPENARRIVRFKRRHLEMMKQLGRGVEVAEVREVETVDVFVEREDFEKAKKQVEDVREWMPEERHRVWEAEEARKEFGVNELVVGAVTYTAGALWPYRLVTSVWNDLLERFPGLSINTHTPVEKVSHNSDGSYTVTTPRGVIKAKHVIHTTNAHAGQLLPPVRGCVVGAIAHMSAQRPGSSFPPTQGNRSWSVIYNPGFDYITQRPDRPDGTPGDLMIGGGFFRSKEDGLDQVGIWDDSKTHALPLMHIRGVMPSVYEPNWGPGSSLIKAWTGIIGFTGDLMPLVGRAPGSKGSGEWMAAGFCGEGMVYAWLCGTALAVMVLDNQTDSSPFLLIPMSLLNMMPEERIDSWRQRVPSRMDRDDPFEGDHFDERPPTRLTFRDVSPPEARPSTRLGFFRAATPMFGRSSTPSSTRPASSLMPRRAEGKRRSLLSLFTRKRKRKEPEEIPRDPVRLNFLFVGSKAAGQTSLLFRSRYGYFPDSNAFSRPLYETYVNERMYHNQPLTYIEWDAVFLCFDISDKISMYTIIQWWHHASDQGFTKSASFAPLLYLVGLKKDLRDQCFLEDHQTGSAFSSSGLLAYPTCCICSSEANWQATRIGAHKYIECSAATGEGMKEVIDDSGREAMRRLVGGQVPEDEVIPKKKRRFF
ncbi:FAD dependent oxidoreductase [Fusarium subglutinans]|uniref:FAD dependent oxidoreductase n=1 Tax=Gibberella subglutinans TaxID=42677 RepID=A0A8H5Q9T7_GIBSU|nr:FAD dependent oxidoreductase [Fusarium subglutinans]KAF5611831.1 FAD dependent oxidoreductase [Fusarium subglutinans]